MKLSLLPPALVVLLASCSGESKAGEKDAVDHFREARAAAQDALGHLRDGLQEGLEDARRHWAENRDEWKKSLDQELDRMAEELRRVRQKGRELVPVLREKADDAGEELRRVRAELVALLERAEAMAEEEWAEKAEALRVRMVELERKLEEMRPK